MTDIEADFAALRQVSDRWTFGDDEEVFVAALSRIETALKEALAERDAEINRRALAEETIEAQHMCLDDMGAPRKDGVGVLSLHGRTLRVIAAMRADLECRTLERDASEAQMNAVCDKLGVADDFDADDAPGQIGRLQETIAALTAAEPFITAELRAEVDRLRNIVAAEDAATAIYGFISPATYKKIADENDALREDLRLLQENRSRVCARLARIEAAAEEARECMSSFRIFVTSRERSHPEGVRMWDGVHDAIRAAIEEGTPT